MPSMAQYMYVRFLFQHSHKKVRKLIKLKFGKIVILNSQKLQTKWNRHV